MVCVHIAAVGAYRDLVSHIRQLEIRVPFSSLRYKHADPQTWGIMLYRN
jgi:hypothetical protein